jgi:[acyl-carrier-protein] S-malonyltransferase
MKPAADKLLAAMSGMEFKVPVIPVIHNADVASHGEPGAIKDALAHQLFSPVRWVESMQSFAAGGVTRIAECGPGKVLAGLNKRILDNVPTMALADANAMADALKQ